jgi:hypothetical protein
VPVSRSTAQNLLLVVLGLLAAAGIVEIALRLGAFGGGGADPAEARREGQGIYRADPHGLYTLKPDLRTSWSSPELSGELTTNDLGFRGPPPDSAEAGGGRLLVLGDSFVFGWGVGDGETLPAQIEEVIASAGDSVRVINLGVPGYGPGRSVGLLREKGLTFDPAAVLLVVTESNDILDDLHFADDPLEATPEGLPGIWGKSHLLRFVHWKSESFLRWSRMTRAANVERTLAYIDDLAGVCAAGGIPLVVALFPSKAQMRAAGLSARVLRWLDVETKIHGRLRDHVSDHPEVTDAVDLHEVLRSAAAKPGEPLFYPVDGHPTPRAYRECAKALAPALRRALAPAKREP